MIVKLKIMAFKFGQGFWRCTLKPLKNSFVSHRCIVVPPNVGEPTRTNQEVIQALTRAIIGGMHKRLHEKILSWGNQIFGIGSLIFLLFCPPGLTI